MQEVSVLKTTRVYVRTYVEVWNTMKQLICHTYAIYMPYLCTVAAFVEALL